MALRAGQGRRPERRSRQTSQGPAVPGLAARQAATRLLAAIIDAHTPLDGLTDAEHGHPQYRALDERDRGLARAILVTALRHPVTIETLISGRLDRPLPPNATALSHVLHVALAQILFLDVPDSAAVDVAVEQAKADPRTRRFAALVNAVLRGVAREKERSLPAALVKVEDAPEWFARRLRQDYGDEHAAAILAAHRLEPPTDFTVKSDPEHWAKALGGIALPAGGVRLARLDRAVADLPGYAEGEWWVQDAAASLPARLLGGVAGLAVADLCAAPGGKTSQLAHGGAHVTAVDISANRLKRLAANLERLRLRAETVAADLLAWEPREKFDAVLLDAPCSSTGTVRRHPDVPWTKTEADVEVLAALQARLLRKAAALVRPGGVLVFSNCSLDPREGEHLIAPFLADFPVARLDPIRPDEIAGAAEFVTPQGFLRTTPAGMRLATPELSGLDGFFAVRFRLDG